MPFDNPTITDFKTYFNRDFPYGTDINTSVTDTDIGNAFLLTNVNMPQDLWVDQPTYNQGYLYLSAHYLVMRLRASSQGLGGRFDGNRTGKGAGSVNESFQTPQWVMDNPAFAMLFETRYGAMYLELILPQMVGQVFNAFGGTLP